MIEGFAPLDACRAVMGFASLDHLRVAMSLRLIIAGIIVVVVAFAGATLLINLFSPSSLQEDRPPLVAVPPLPPLAGTSTILTPAAVAMSAIRDALEAQAPRNLSGNPQNPVSQLLQAAELNFTINRGPLTVTGRPDALVVTTALSRHLPGPRHAHRRGDAIGGAFGNIIGGNLGAAGAGPHRQDLRPARRLSRHGDGAVAPDHRVELAACAEPHRAGQCRRRCSADRRHQAQCCQRSEAGARQYGARADRRSRSRVRNDPFIENAARAEWAKLCRAISLGAAAQATAPGVPDLWLEIRPVRAIAAQPKIDANAVTLLVGVQAETRIVPSETKPTCPFPAQLDIVPQANEGILDIAVPIDIPFTEVSRLIEAQVKGKTFPEDGSGAFATTIKQAAVAASGDRLLISLLVNVKKRGFFAIGADATVHVWGKPVLDQTAQILRFTDVALDVQSQAAFGLLGEAAKAAVPYLQKTLADQAVIDLKPFAADAKKRMAAAVGDFTGAARGVSANVVVNDLRLIGIAYDDKNLRIVADAKGNASVAISSLTWQ